MVAVLNIATDSELLNEIGISSRDMRHTYNTQSGVKIVVHSPITQLPVSEPTQDIPKVEKIKHKKSQKHLLYGAHYLNDMINNKDLKRVYVHCLNGCERAPTLVLAYLCIYFKISV